MRWTQNKSHAWYSRHPCVVYIYPALPFSWGGHLPFTISTEEELNQGTISAGERTLSVFWRGTKPLWFIPGTMRRSDTALPLGISVLGDPAFRWITFLLCVPMGEQTAGRRVLRRPLSTAYEVKWYATRYSSRSAFLTSMAEPHCLYFYYAYRAVYCHWARRASL